MKKEDRKILLLVDNFSGHYVEKEYSNVRIEFFAANMTSLIQPCDMGAIAFVKSNLRKYVNKSLTNDLAITRTEKIRFVNFIMICQNIL